MKSFSHQMLSLIGACVATMALTAVAAAPAAIHLAGAVA